MEGLVDAVVRFCRAASWAECQQHVEENRTLLLDPRALEIIDRLLASNAGNEGAVHTLTMRRQALRDCADQGIEATFAPLRRRDQLHDNVNALNDARDPRQRALHAGKALAALDREDDPEMWDQLHDALGTAHMQAGFAAAPDGSGGGDAAVAIEHYEQALKVFTDPGSPEWYSITASLGLALMQLTTGDARHNTRRAVACLESARDRGNADPDSRLRLESNLAVAYLTQARDGDVERYDRVIEILTRALAAGERMFARDRLASYHRNLGNALVERPGGKQNPKDLAAAVEHYQAGRALLDDDDLRAHADLCMDTHAAYRDQGAIELAEQQLIEAEALARRGAPDRLPHVRRYLGVLLTSYAGSGDDVGARRTRAEQALRDALALGEGVFDADVIAGIHDRLGRVVAARGIDGNDPAALREALGHLERGGDRGALGTAHRALGRLLERDAPDHATLREAELHARAAIDALQTGEHREALGESHYLLGLILVNRVRSSADRVADDEAARASYLAAQELLDRERSRTTWLHLQASLAHLLINRQVGTQDDNAAAALACITPALERIDREDEPSLWRRLTLFEGIAWQQLTRGDRTANVERGITALQRLDTPEVRAARPSDWARAQHNLGQGFGHRLLGDPEDNGRAAVTHYRRALEVFTEEAFPRDWAMAHHNLGLLFAGVLDDRAAALYHFERALRVRTREADAAAWARTVMHQGLAYLLPTRGGPATAEDRERAVASFRLALTALDRARHTYFWAATHFNLGTVLRSREDLELAAAAFAEGDFPARAVTTLGHLASLDFEDGRWTEALGRYREAIAINRGLFAEATSEAGALTELADASPLHPSAAYCQIRLGDRAGALETLERGKARALADALAEDEAAAATTRAGLSAAEICALAPAGGALVAPIVTTRGSVVFIVPGGARSIADAQLLELPALTSSRLRELLVGWLVTYTTHDADWHAALQRLIDELWSEIMGPIHGELAGLHLAPAAPLLIVPQGGLGLLPLHAPSRIVDDYTVWYAPSAGAMAVSLRRLGEHDPGRRRVAIVSDPTGDLQHAAGEAADVRDLFPEAGRTLLDRATARRAEVQAAMLGRSHVHFACHGTYAFDDPGRSALLLADGERLSIRDILDGPRLDARLVVLSGCETGMTDVLRVPDELLGFPGAFLHAGATAVVSSLWAVPDRSTSLLMAAMYRAMLVEQQAPAAALRQAQRWLRDLDVGGHRPFAHPYHWAAFTITGV